MATRTKKKKLVEGTDPIQPAPTSQFPPAMRWGWRAVHPDGRSSNGFRWPLGGGWVDAGGPIIQHGGACPEMPGDGICIGLKPEGVASGGIPAITCLIVGWMPEDELGRDEIKVRVRRARVLEVVDLPRWIREGKFSGANLSSANLRSADLYSANLSSANLRGADLYSANLRGADLSSADLYSANLSSANLRGADLSSANLRGANLSGANWNDLTVWPPNFTPPKK